MKKSIDAVYIHIPFCQNICSYCDFCKIYYQEKIVDKYLSMLEMEIKNKYQNDIITTLYIGGGTPSCLSDKELRKLFRIIKIFKLSSSCEITFEANVESLDLSKIKLLKENGVNRISLGMETINSKLQKIINRKTSKTEIINCINNLRNNDIYNINLDLMYALPSETVTDLLEDLTFLLSLDVPHISTYSLILEDHTKLKIEGYKQIDSDLDYYMYNIITNTLKSKSYIHYEVSNFSKSNYQSKHNLKYWNNCEYYGFGAGASGYINNIRYDNTRSITKYLNGKTVMDEELLTIKDIINYEVILNLRTNEGIIKENFKNKFNISLDKLFKYKTLVKDGFLVENYKQVFVNEKYIYVLNEIILKFLSTLQTNVYDDTIYQKVSYV